ncbi:hypothetical protein [Tindallia californiensis]|uniref:Uncharacterized protein n=1 Tax=Tindallia californiensis TaxID=159292 RepID=A0A1H3JJP1_9FIRM|nr:hypothetical protein [Tindallia californiensis]SDY40142.1 hypothetical protein SAMN05192546_1026 [Tindallia californiensis]
MENFDYISIENISKKDFLMILQALEYTGEHTNIQEFVLLKDDLIQQLTDLSEISVEELFSSMQDS